MGNRRIRPLAVVKELVGRLYHEDFEGTFDEVIERLKTKKASCPGYDNLRVEYEWGCDDPGSYSVYGDRPQTEKEIEHHRRQREGAKIRKAKERAEAEERARKEYERLKKRFGDS